jgi:hypothetical protein
MYCIGGVLVSMLASSMVDRGFVPRSGQTKDFEIGICCFSSKNFNEFQPRYASFFYLFLQLKYLNIIFTVVQIKFLHDFDAYLFLFLSQKPL